MPADTLTISADSRDTDAVRRTSAVLADGGVAVFPTETVYGIGASVAHAGALDRLRQIKNRPADQPFTVHLPDADAVARYVDLDKQTALRRLAPRTMPGPITYIVEVDDDTIARKLDELGLPPDARNRLYHGNTIGLRCPDHAIARQVLAGVEAPVVASSANLSGDPAPTSADGVADALGDAVDVVLDAGPCRYAKASTIVRVHGTRLEVIRPGVYDQRYLEKLMRRTILFVCSGNTCRSPMAEAIARHELSARLGVPADELDSAGLRVVSAGAFAMPGAPITPEAADALRQMNIDGTAHKARSLTPELIREAEAIWCMTDSHRHAVAEIAPDMADKAALLDPDGPIDDPIGAGPSVYVKCAQRIRTLIGQRLDQMGLPAGG